MNEDLIKEKINELRHLTNGSSSEIQNKIHRLEKSLLNKSKEMGAWERVLLSRHIDRPGTLEMVKLISDEFVELHGDRCYGDDPAIVGGIAKIDGIPFTFIGHEKGINMKDKIYRNYGCGNPEGYRKAMRLAKQAEKFNRPLVTFINTSGAYPGIAAEERGIGQSIAESIKLFSMLKTPIICFILGEGGSGGALGIGVGDKIYMLENSVYSVISPEGFASLLLRDPGKAKEAAEMMKMTSYDLQEFGIINGIIPEVEGGIQNNPEFSAIEIKNIILENLKNLGTKNKDALVRYRSKKIMSIGHFTEGSTEYKELFNFFDKIKKGSNQ